jgi:hypothetical protein
MRTLAALIRCIGTLTLLAVPLSAAWAEPDRVAWSSVEGAGIVDLSITEDGRWVAFHETESDEVRFLDLGSWDVLGSVAACSGSIGGLAITGTDGDYQAFIGCSDGSIVRAVLDDEGLVEVGDGAGTDAQGDTGQAAASSGDDDWSTAVSLDGAGAVLAVETDGTTVYAVAEQEDDGNPRVHLVDIDSAGETTSGNYPSLFGQGGLADSWLGNTYLFVSHGSQKVSKVDLATGSISVSSENISADMGDMDAWNDNAAFLADADSQGGVVKYLPNGGVDSFQILLSEYNTDLNSVSSVVVDGDDGFLIAYDHQSTGIDGTAEGEMVVFEFDANSNTVGDDELQRFAAAHAAEMVRREGYVVAGGDSGTLQVLTDLPWVEISTVEPGAAIAGQEVTVSFTSDDDGSWELLLGGTEYGDGESLASGSCEAGVESSAGFEVDSAFEEGDNLLWLLVTSSAGTGHDRGVVNVDNPPSRVALVYDSDTGVGFGDSQITVAFEGIDDEDLASYTIYVSTTEFFADDFPEGTSGGPACEGVKKADEDIPLEVTGIAPGESVSRTISPLTNDVTYYVGVRAIDAGGQESAMSNVVSVTPLPTIGAAELAGETGGYCGTRTPWGFAAIGLAGLLIPRRRRGAVVAALLLLVGAPRAVAAADEEEHPRAHGDIELRYGPMFPSNESVTSVYGSSGHGVAWIEGGVRVTRFAELDVGAGFYQELSTKVAQGDSDYHSAEHTMLTAWPLTGALTARLDIFHEQLLVPTARIGADYWLWKENWYVNPDVGGDSEMTGGEWGWHYGFGANLLLDRFDPRRASWLEAISGIDDTYLVVDWRRTTLGAFGTGDGVSLLDGSMLTVGIKLDM